MGNNLSNYCAIILKVYWSESQKICDYMFQLLVMNSLKEHYLLLFHIVCEEETFY